MIHLERVADEIQNVGLYDLVLQDVEKIAGKTKPPKDEILEIIHTHPQILEDYKQINLEYNISNLHIRPIDIDSVSPSCKEEARAFNENLQQLKEIEKYTLDFEQSSTLVIIFSIEFFVLFSVQYFIVLLNLKDWQWWIYTLFALSVLFAWLYAKKVRKLYEKNSKIFFQKYAQTQALLTKLEQKGCIRKEDLIVKECEEHV